MNRKVVVFSTLFLIALVVSFGFVFRAENTREQASIKWLTIEEAAALSAKDGKKIVVDVYTDWCGWCKKMDKATYENAMIIEMMNKDFHAVKLNAEQKGDITLKGQAFKYVANGNRGYHEYAARLLGGKLSYPSTVFLNPDLTPLYNVPGYREAKEFSAILSYTQAEAYKRISFQDYVNTYQQPSIE